MPNEQNDSPFEADDQISKVDTDIPVKPSVNSSKDEAPDSTDASADVPRPETSTSVADPDVADSIPVRTSTTSSSESMPSSPVDTISNQPKVAAPFATEPSTQPSGLSPSGFQPAVQPTKSRMSKKLLAGIIAGVAAIALIGGGAAAYTWYQNPQKVINDAIVALVSAKNYTADGSVKFTPKGSSASDANPVDVTYNIKGTRYSGTLDANLKTSFENKDISVSGSLVYSDKSDVYFKLSGIEDVMNVYAESTGEQLPAAVNTLIQKIDGKWYVITNQDLKDISPESAKVQACVTDAMHEVDKDSSLLREVGEAYAKNQFIVVKKELGMKNGSVGYQIDSDKTKAKDFGKALKETKLYKKVIACSPDAKDSMTDTTDMTTSESSSTAVAELWVDQWGHQPTKIVIKDDTSSASIVLENNMKLNTAVSVNAPSGATSYKELQKDVDALTSATYGAVQARAKSSASQAYAASIMKHAEAYYALNGKYPTYTELLAAKDEAMLDETTKQYISATAPTASTNMMVQYQNCSANGSVIRYFDSTTNTVKSLDLGEGCKSV